MSAAVALLDTKTANDDSIPVTFRRPEAEDGAAVNALIAACDPLDENSLYCNLLQCTHFAETCVLAEVPVSRIMELEGEKGAKSDTAQGDDEPMQVVGFVSGYLLPDDSERFFVWQVAVDPRMRGMSLGKRMVKEILLRPNMVDVNELHTTITRTNKASHALFTSIARGLDTDIERELVFSKEDHFDGNAASEILWKIGPIERSRLVTRLDEPDDEDVQAA